MPREPLDVFYDGACPLCVAAARSWREGEQAGLLCLRPLQGDLPPGAPDRSLLSREIHAHGPSGWLSGARALLAVYHRLTGPGAAAMALALRLGIAVGVADPLYRLLARHRSHLPALARLRRPR